MQSRKTTYFLIIIFVLALILRLSFVFQEMHFSDDSAYFHLRYAEHISKTGKPITFDQLSFNGKEVNYPYFYHYFLAFFSSFIPIDIVAKLIPSILMAFIPLIVFLISREITKDDKASLLAAFISIFIPILMQITLNDASIYSLVLPMFFFMIYCMIKMREERVYLVYFIILSMLLALTHPSAFIFVLTIIFYMLLIISQGWKVRRVNKEALLFASLLILLLQFIFYKESFSFYGLSVFKDYLPASIVFSYFENINLFEIIIASGVLSLILGTIAIFFTIFRETNDDSLLLASILLSVLFLLLFRLIPINVALIFLSITFVILSSYSIKKLYSYVEITKFSKYKDFLLPIIFFFIIVSMTLPSIAAAQKTLDNVPNQLDIDALEWIKENIEEDVVILSILEEGHLVTYITGKSNVIDNQFLLIRFSEQRLQDVNFIYTAALEFRVFTLLEKYDVDFIFLSEKAKEKFNIKDLAYSSNEKCFMKRKYETPKIYQVREC